MPRQYPEELKKQVVSFCVAGNPLSVASEKYQLAQSTIYRWCREYDLTGDQTTVKDSTIRRQCERMEHILQIIRLSNIIEGVPRRKRLEILAKLHEQFEQYSVHELCEALDVSRGTFYNHIFRRADLTEYSVKQQELMKQVQQFFDDSKQRFGAEKIRITLRECGVHVGKRRIREIMKELGLVSVRENAKSSYRSRQEYLKRNLLNQEFKAIQPDEIWVSDITYFKIKGYAVYLCVIIDIVVSGTIPCDHPEIMHHREGFDLVPGNRSLSAVEVGLVNVMNRETVLRQYVDSVKQDYDYVLLDCRPSLGMLAINALSASDYVLIPV